MASFSIVWRLRKTRRLPLCHLRESDLHQERIFNFETSLSTTTTTIASPPTITSLSHHSTTSFNIYYHPPYMGKKTKSNEGCIKHTPGHLSQLHPSTPPFSISTNCSKQTTTSPHTRGRSGRHGYIISSTSFNNPSILYTQHQHQIQHRHTPLFFQFQLDQRLSIQPSISSHDHEVWSLFFSPLSANEANGRGQR